MKTTEAGTKTWSLGLDVATKSGEINTGRKKKEQSADYVNGQEAGTYARRLQTARI